MREDFNETGQLEICGAMNKEMRHSPDRLGWDNLAAEALDLAWLMPPGPERNEALKLASQASIHFRRPRISLCKTGKAAKVNTAGVACLTVATMLIEKRAKVACTHNGWGRPRMHL